MKSNYNQILVWLTLSFLFLLMNGKLQAQQVFDTLITTNRTIVLFNSDSDFIENNCLDSLIEILNKSNSSDDFRFIINAHTDDVGSDKYNEALALRRLKSVKLILEKSGIPAEKIVSYSHGESSPLFSILNDKNRSLSRRVEIDLQLVKKVKRIVTRVVNANTNEGITATIIIKSNGLESYHESQNNGSVGILYPLSQSVEIEAQSENFFFKNLNLKPNIIGRLDTIIVKMFPFKIGSTFNLDKLNFVSNKCVLVPNSLPTLYRLKDFMLVNASKCIQICGHINFPNEDPVNIDHVYFDLSVSRANVIYDSLRMYGIDKKRMYTKGYGNWEMKFPTSNKESEMAQNRRVEIRVEDCNSVVDKINELVKQPRFHGYIPIYKKYDPSSIEFDLKGILPSDKKLILETIDDLLAKGDDPERYSYAQLMKM